MMRSIYNTTADQVLVMDAGRRAEFGPPRDLRAIPGGIYASLATAAGLPETRAPDEVPDDAFEL